MTVKTILRSAGLAALALSVVSTTAQAGGFLLNDHGAKATGRVDAVSATVTDGSAIFYNPGGVGAAEGTHIYLGASLIMPSSTFNDEASGTATDSETGVAVTPNAYFHTQTHEIVRVGLGFFTPFGSSLEWPETSPGRDISRKSSLRTFYITPVVGLDLGKWIEGLTVGAGIDFIPSTVSIERDLIFGNEVGSVELNGNGFGVGTRVGAQYRAPFLKGLSLGASWRSEARIRYEGGSDFDIAEPFRSSLPPDGDIEAQVTLPAMFQGGIAFGVSGLEIEADLQWVGWSSVDSLDIDLADGSQTIDVRNYEDVFTYRLGVEYDIASAGLAVRAGYAYDPTPIPVERLSVSLPDINRNVVSAGASYNLPKGFIDFGFLYVLPGDRDNGREPGQPQLKGNFEVSAFVFALSYGLTLGADDDAGGAPLPAEVATK